MMILPLLLVIFGYVAALAVSAAGIFLLYRRIKVNRLRREHKISSEQGIDEEVILPVGGIQQFLYIRGQNTQNPIILFLHGGPGGAMIPMLHTYQYLWEDDYTVVNWDQRAAGKTYFLNKDKTESIASTLSAEVMLQDIHEIICYLTKRFGKEKVIIVGHSWGTILGSQFSLAHPELVEAYVGIAQAVDINDGILSMAKYTRKLARGKKAEKDIAALERIIDQVQSSAAVAEKETLAICKIAKRYMPINMDTTIFLKSGLFSPYYTLREMTYYAKMDELTKPFAQYLLDYDLREIGSSYDIPVIFIFGEYDWHMNLLAQEYFGTVTAPMKNYISIPGAGHVAMMDNPTAFFSSLHDALQEIRQQLSAA